MDKSMNVIIHAAFRRDLGRFEAALASFPDGSTARAAQLRSAWTNYETQLHDHHTGEETLFWPALEKVGVDPALVEVLASEHEAMSRALDEASAAMEQFFANPTSAEAVAARDALERLRVVLTNHLDHEERVLEPVVLKYHDSPPMKAAQKQVRVDMKGKTGTYIAWLLDGADDDTRIALKKFIPPPVLYAINTFGGRDYRRSVASVWRPA